MPEELWMEICNIVPSVTKPITTKKKYKKRKWLSEEALHIAEENRSKRQGRKGKIYLAKSRVPENAEKR